MLRRVLLGEGGAGVAAGTLLMFGLGLLLVLRDAPALRVTLQAEPTPRACASWAAEPARHRWVRLTGCREAGPPRELGSDAGLLVALELPDGTRAGWLAPGSPAPGARGEGEDGGASAAPGEALRGRTGTSERRTGDGALAPVLGEGEDGGASAAPGEPLRVLTGTSERRTGDGALAPVLGEGEDGGASAAPGEPLRVLTGTSELRTVDGAPTPVLLEGRDPRSGRVLVTALAGLALMIWALWPIARRWQLVRESDAQAEALRRRGGD